MTPGPGPSGPKPTHPTPTRPTTPPPTKPTKAYVPMTHRIDLPDDVELPKLGCRRVALSLLSFAAVLVGLLVWAVS